MSTPAIVSIHDVMPHTLNDVDYCLDQLRQHRINSVYLLVVPGLNWSPAGIDKLRSYVASGHTLVAHGWHHKANSIRGIKHRLHSLFISRDVAEHLCLNRSERVALMQQSRSWFERQGFPVPDVYVPPAWALGRMSLTELRQTGFRVVETTSGLLDIERSLVRRLPLLGYEADTRLRAVSVSIWNWFNSVFTASRNRSSGTIYPLRLSIHPSDFKLLLAKGLQRDLAKVNSVRIDSALSFTAALPRETLT